MMRSRAPARILARQLAQVQPFYHFHDKARQMILRQSVFHRRREKVIGLAIYGYETAHQAFSLA
jgi:hypothetical protein